MVTYDGARFWVGVNEEEKLDEIIAAGGRKGEIYAQLRDLRDRYADDIRAGYVPVDKVPRRVSGYNLDEQRRLKLTPALLHRTMVVVQYDDLPDAAEQLGGLGRTAAADRGLCPRPARTVCEARPGRCDVRPLR
ncbi:hypothetical protein ACWDWO_23185 [Actinopolymorpha singaporensis]